MKRNPDGGPQGVHRGSTGVGGRRWANETSATKNDRETKRNLHGGPRGSTGVHRGSTGGSQGVGLGGGRTKNQRTTTIEINEKIAKQGRSRFNDVWIDWWSSICYTKMRNEEGKAIGSEGEKKKTRKKKENVKISRVKNLQNSIRVRRFDFCKLRPPKKKKEAKRRTHAIPFFFF